MHSKCTGVFENKVELHICTLISTYIGVLPGFQKGRVPSEKGTNGPSKGPNLHSELNQNGTISAVNGKKRALLTW